MCAYRLAYAQGNDEQALTYLQQQEAHCKQDHNERELALSQTAQALVYLELNDVNRAQALYDYGKALQTYKENHVGQPSEVAEILTSVALTLFALNDVEPAAQLLGAAEGVFKRVNFYLPVKQRQRLDRLRDELNATLGDARFNTLWDQAMSQDEALERALKACDAHR